ncbi:MAG: SWIM zinc finger family protein [bacterium]|nr:SWIM zinc finger family protein [bacterium]
MITMSNFDIAQIIDELNPNIYERGERYYAEGRVKNLRFKNDILMAEVAGTEEYRVRIENIQGDLDCHCTCPYAEEAICKHIVAVLLAWQNRNEVGQNSFGHITDEEQRVQLKQLLSQKSKKELTDFILEHIPEAQQDLILAEGSRTENIGRVFSRSIKSKINSLFRKGRFIDYQASFTLADELATISSSIEKAAQQDPNLGLELGWYLLKKSKNIFDVLDDSSGAFSSELQAVAELLTQWLGEVKESPEKNKIIHEIFQEWQTDDYGFFDCLQKVLFESALSKTEIALILPEIDLCIEKALKKINTAKGEFDRRHHSFTLSQLVFLYAKLMLNTQKIEQGLNRFKQYLPLTEDYQRLGEMLIGLNREQEAEEVLLEGLQKYPGRKEGIYDGLVFLYAERKEKEKLKKVLLSYFYNTPSCDLYQKLKKLKLPEWNKLQPELVTFLDTQEHYYILIEIYLAEKKLLPAFELAKKYDAGWEQFVSLGEILTKNHPTEAIWCYQRAAEITITKGSRYYWAVLKHIAQIKQLYLLQGKNIEFQHYLQTLKEIHQKKRTFIAKLSRFSS